MSKRRGYVWHFFGAEKKELGLEWVMESFTFIFFRHVVQLKFTEA